MSLGILFCVLSITDEVLQGSHVFPLCSGREWSGQWSPCSSQDSSFGFVRAGLFPFCQSPRHLHATAVESLVFSLGSLHSSAPHWLLLSWAVSVTPTSQLVLTTPPLPRVPDSHFMQTQDSPKTQGGFHTGLGCSFLVPIYSLCTPLGKHPQGQAGWVWGSPPASTFPKIMGFCLSSSSYHGFLPEARSTPVTASWPHPKCHNLCLEGSSKSAIRLMLLESKSCRVTKKDVFVEGFCHAWCWILSNDFSCIYWNFNFLLDPFNVVNYIDRFCKYFAK